LGTPFACSVKVTWAYAIRPFSLICAAPCAAYGLLTSPTPSMRPIDSSAGSIRERTDSSRTVPSSTFHTTVSVSPDRSGKAFCIRLYARVESVFGRVKVSA
jgi:hypothetical protein